MKSVDANILLRWLTRDDQRQAAIADSVMATNVFVSLTVLVEVAWVLRKSYGFDRRMVNAAISTLADLESITVEREEGVRWALARQADGADLPDMLHIVASVGAAAFVTFERRLAKRAGPNPPVPVETLA